MTARSAIALIAAIGASACGPRVMKLPSGSGSPVSDASTAVAEALGRCASLQTLTAEIGVRGMARGHRIRGRLTAGVTAPASARLEAPAPFGQPLFIFVATGEDATLWLPRDQRVLAHARPDAVLEAVAGVPLNAADLWTTVTGCPAVTPNAAGARAFGNVWRVVPAVGGGELYLNRAKTTGRWQLVALLSATLGGRQWRAEFRDFQQHVPRLIHLASPGSSTFDLQLTLSQVDVNVALGADAFRVDIPASATTITLEELRQSGPLAGTTRRSHAR